MIQCFECQPPINLASIWQAALHFQRMHYDLLAGLSEYEQADAIAKGLRRVKR